jgi:branched-chain amino acid aminotransferase
MEETEKIWMDGEFVGWKEAKIHVLTHTLHYGGGVFEGIRAYKTEKGPAVFRLPEHIKRLFYSASCLEMEIPFSEDEIEKAVLDTVRVNKVNGCYIRPIVFFGYGKMGLNPEGAPVRVAIAVWPWGAYLGDDKVIKVKISKYIRIHPKSTITDAKICGHYVNSIFSSLEAKKENAKEALLLDFEGYVAEGPGENIFIVKDGQLYTPPLGTILAGITRDSVIKIAKDLDIGVEERKISVGELKSADEAFFVGTAAEVCPIGKIDGNNIADGKPGQITMKIQKIYKRAVKGQEEKYLNWLTFV